MVPEDAVSLVFPGQVIRVLGCNLSWTTESVSLQEPSQGELPVRVAMIFLLCRGVYSSFGVGPRSGGCVVTISRTWQEQHQCS